MSLRCRGGNNRRRLEIQNLHLTRLDAPVFERCQQAVMGGGDKRYGDTLADKVFRFGDGFFHHQRFGSYPAARPEGRLQSAPVG